VTRARPRVLLALAGLALSLGPLGATPLAMADDVPSPGVGLHAEVTSAPSGDHAQDATGSGADLAGDQDPEGAPAPTDTQVLGGDEALTPAPSAGAEPGGVLAVSGLRVDYRSGVDPRGGPVHVQATVKNVSDQVMDVGAQFSATTIFGMQLDRAAPTTVSRLAPGELRVVDASLSGVGQWGAVEAHLTLHPAVRVDGADAAPVTRDSYLLAPPWFSILLATLLAAGVVVWRRAGRPTAARVPAGAVQLIGAST